eukprot:GHVO01059393.1.p1 GENE.GHVO01059393.1~~GHVO01059393.1.p1  ORF type:complete len:185 (-),score=11.64 GHVO01059393.1:76-630(-)
MPGFRLLAHEASEVFTQSRSTLNRPFPRWTAANMQFQEEAIEVFAKHNIFEVASGYSPGHFRDYDPSMHFFDSFNSNTHHSRSAILERKIAEYCTRTLLHSIRNIKLPSLQSWYSKLHALKESGLAKEFLHSDHRSEGQRQDRESRTSSTVRCSPSPTSATSPLFRPNEGVCVVTSRDVGTQSR